MVVSRLEATGATEQVSITKDWYFGYLKAIGATEAGFNKPSDRQLEATAAIEQVN